MHIPEPAQLKLPPIDINDVEVSDGEAEIKWCRVDSAASKDIVRYKIDATDAWFELVDFSAGRIRSVYRSVFTDCKFQGTQIEQLVSGVRFKNCVIRDVDFRWCRIRDVIFEECVIENCNFFEASLRNVKFPKSTFRGLGFDRSKIVNVDMSGLLSLEVGDPNTLAGCLINEIHIPAIADRLIANAGILIEKR